MQNGDCSLVHRGSCTKFSVHKPFRYVARCIFISNILFRLGQWSAHWAEGVCIFSVGCTVYSVRAIVCAPNSMKKNLIWKIDLRCVRCKAYKFSCEMPWTCVTDWKLEHNIEKCCENEIWATKWKCCSNEKNFFHLMISKNEPDAR